MSNKNDTAVCVVCGKHYKTCLSCRNQKLKPWRNIADSINCYKIFLTLSQYNNHHISKDEAKRQLETISYNKNELKESVRDEITKIIYTSETVKKPSLKNNPDKKCEQ